MFKLCCFWFLTFFFLFQMAPSSMKTMQMEAVSGNKESSMIQTFQLWRKNGSCPTGTIPIRRIRDIKSYSSQNYGKKVPSFPFHPKKPNVDRNSNNLEVNRSVNSYDPITFVNKHYFLSEFNYQLRLLKCILHILIGIFLGF